MPDASARIWAILGALLLMGLMVVALRWTFGTDRKVPTARLGDPHDPTAFGLLEEVSRVPGALAAEVLQGRLAAAGIRADAQPRRPHLPDPRVPGRPQGRPGGAQPRRPGVMPYTRWYLASKKQNTP